MTRNVILEGSVVVLTMGVITWGLHGFATGGVRTKAKDPAPSVSITVCKHTEPIADQSTVTPRPMVLTAAQQTTQDQHARTFTTKFGRKSSRAKANRASSATAEPRPIMDEFCKELGEEPADKVDGA